MGHDLTLSLRAGGHRGLTWPRGLSRGVPIAWVQLGLLFAPLLTVPFFRLVDNDYWWHLKTGELLLESGLIRRDPYSWTANGEPWVTHEWMSEALIYVVQASLGYWAAALLFAAAAIAALTIAYGLGRSLGAGARVLVLTTLVSMTILATFVTIRPQVFTWLLFAVFLRVLMQDTEGKPAPLIALPPLMTLWANLHLGFFYGFMLLGVWLLSLAIEGLRGRSIAMRRAIAISIACVLAACLNPEGPALLWYPLRYITNAGATHAYVSEWQSPDPMSPFHAPIFLGVGLLATAIISRGRPRTFLLLVTIAVIAMALQAVRNAPFVALLLPPVVATAAARRWPWASHESDGDVRMHAVPAFALAGAVLSVISVFMLAFGSAVSLQRPSDRSYPSEGAAYLREHQPGARLFNDYGWGGYLIHELYPYVLVGIDGRTDFYGDAILADYYAIVRLETGWQSKLDAWGADVLLIPRESLLARALRDDPGWRETFTADREAVFVRAAARPPSR